MHYNPTSLTAGYKRLILQPEYTDEKKRQIKEPTSRFCNTPSLRLISFFTTNRRTIIMAIIRSDQLVALCHSRYIYLLWLCCAQAKVHMRLRNAVGVAGHVLQGRPHFESRKYCEQMQ